MHGYDIKDGHAWAISTQLFGFDLCASFKEAWEKAKPTGAKLDTNTKPDCKSFEWKDTFPSPTGPCPDCYNHCNKQAKPSEG